MRIPISVALFSIVLSVCSTCTGPKPTTVASFEDNATLTDWQNVLVGNWSTPAWEGVLRESWVPGNDGALTQTATYAVGGDVQYEAVSRMAYVGGELILLTVIKDADPKVFRATSVSAKEIVFENTSYRNPNKVIYRRTAAGHYERTISGTEPDGTPSTYTFRFSPR